MEHQQAEMLSRQQTLVPDDKFDRHMTRARLQDIENRKIIFCQQTERKMEQVEQRGNIAPSCY